MVICGRSRRAAWLSERSRHARTARSFPASPADRLRLRRCGTGACEGVVDRIQHGRNGSGDAALARTLDADRILCRRRRVKIHIQRRKIVRARQTIIHQRSRDQLTVIVIGNPFQQDLSNSLRDPAMDLTVHDQRVDDGSHVVDGAIGNDVHLPGLGIDLDFAHM